jgi:hypothetical protein
MQCAQQIVHGYARSRVRLAARPLAGRTASARTGCIGSIVRAPSIASDHHRNRPSPEPILHRATERICFCEMLVASTTDSQRAALVRVLLLANSDPKARSALRIRIERGQIDRAHQRLARTGDTAQSVRDPDASNCRYQEPPAPWLQNSEVPPTRLTVRSLRRSELLLAL